MSSIQQRAELQAQIWRIANDVRGSVDGWDFKQFVLGSLFYRFISENFETYIQAGDDSVNYAALPDSVITPEIKDDAVKTKGYFIYPSQLFKNVVQKANENENLNTSLKDIFTAIESSANGYPSEHDIKGLFADFDTTSNRLGNTVKDKNTRLAAVLKGVAGLNFGNFEDNKIDHFGDAYEFLISNYAANAGKSSCEQFFKKETNNNVLTDAHIERIMELFDRKEDVPHVAKSVDCNDIAANDYNLSVSSYVEAKDTREVVDISKLNEEIKTTVEKIDKLRSDIDAIVEEIEGGGQ
jgi:type I restriction-modification system DNA methylase subunit